jgi:glycosyltransferase involved in cell wall biosynthesis
MRYPCQGGLQWNRGLDIAIRAFATLKRKLPDARFHIYGDGSSKRQLMALADELSLNESVKFFDPLSLGAIARVVADTDLGVPNRMTQSDARFSWNLCCRRWNLQCRHLS